MNKELYQKILDTLHSELVPAMGCTEPIAIAYCASIARKILGFIPTKVDITVSGNILKNVKSVIVPNTGGLRGVISACAAGIIAGDDSLGLECISKASESQIVKMREYIDNTEFDVFNSDYGCVFDIGVKVYYENEYSFVRIKNSHTNVVLIEKNNEVLFSKECDTNIDYSKTDFTIADIVEFVTNSKIEDFEEIINRQIKYNSAIALEGITNDYGARVGKILLSAYGDNVHIRARAMAAAGSDARMNGCSLPVVIVSGSGNQGITASIPVIEYAKELKVSNEEMLRAVLLSDLVTIHLKYGIGKLSAYCGAVSAGVASGAGICYLYGGRLPEISHTIVNGLAITSGIICDGAKSSCAAKISAAVDAGLFGMEMFKRDSQFYGGDGIIEKGIENTIHNVGILARDGMKETDQKIINLMIKGYK